jgi:uncharacterized protein YutE (UPF0331/DUF86 family)
LVDAERAGARLARLEKLIENLGAIRIEGEDNYLTEEQLRMRAERQLELAVQICIDTGTQLVIERSVRPPESYADVFRAMAEADRKVFSSLESLDDLREFAKVVATQID